MIYIEDDKKFNITWNEDSDLDLQQKMCIGKKIFEFLDVSFFFDSSNLVYPVHIFGSV